MKNLLNQYNHPETVMVLTSYPNPVNGKYGKREFNAMDEHSERRLPFLAKERRVLVLAEDIGTRKYFKPQDNLLVARLWKKGNILSFVKMAGFILKKNRIKSLLVQFEFNLFGGTIPNITAVLMLAVLRLFGKRITFEAHQVTTDIGQLKKHINITNPLLQRFYNTGLMFFYITIGIVANDIIVFEEEMKKRLSRFVPKEKIHVLCLSVDKQPQISRSIARKKLNLSQKEFILLVFGFINGYKGIDWIINQFKSQNSKVKIDRIRLLIAGGQNPYLRDKPHYQAFYRSIVKQAKQNRQATYADFVPDDKVCLYFSAADLVVMPYEVFMSASGPFSRALAHQKPVILSEKLIDYSNSADFDKALKYARLQKKDIFFNLTQTDLFRLIKKAKSNKSYYQKLLLFSQTLAEYRSHKAINKRLNDILFPVAIKPVVIKIQASQPLPLRVNKT